MTRTAAGRRALGRPARSRPRCVGAGAVALVLLGVLATPAAAAAPSARDRAILTAGTIQSRDVPAGWAAHQQGSGSGTQFNGIAACKTFGPVVNSALRTVPHRRSAEFSDPASITQTTFVANTAYAFKDEPAATQYLGAYRADTVATCFSKSLQRAVQSSLRGANATINVGALTNLAGLGDDEVGYTVALTVSTQGGPQTLYDDIIAVRVGRAVLGFNFQNLGAELPVGPAIIRQATSRVAPLAT